jgi:hypothetical protein
LEDVQAFAKKLELKQKETKCLFVECVLHYKIGEAKTTAQRTATDNVVSFKSSQAENQTPVLPNMD